MTKRRQFFQWFVWLECVTLFAVVIMYATNDFGMGGTTARDIGFLASFFVMFQIYILAIAVCAKGSPWPFHE